MTQATHMQGIAAAPFAIFYHADGYSLTIERHDGPSPVRWTIEPPKLAKAIETMLGEPESPNGDAAPDMLAALRAMVNDAHSTGCDGCAVISAQFIVQAEAAIAKAVQR